MMGDDLGATPEEVREDLVDDLTHYMQATGRLARENASLRARLAESEAGRARFEAALRVARQWAETYLGMCGCKECKERMELECEKMDVSVIAGAGALEAVKEVLALADYAKRVTALVDREWIDAADKLRAAFFLEAGK